MRFANGIARGKPEDWYEVQMPSGNLMGPRFKSSLRAAEYAMRRFHVDNWNLLKDDGFRIVPCKGPPVEVPTWIAIPVTPSAAAAGSVMVAVVGLSTVMLSSYRMQ